MGRAGRGGGFLLRVSSPRLVGIPSQEETLGVPKTLVSTEGRTSIFIVEKGQAASPFVPRLKAADLHWHKPTEPRLKRSACTKAPAPTSPTAMVTSITHSESKALLAQKARLPDWLCGELNKTQCDPFRKKVGSLQKRLEQRVGVYLPRIKRA